MKYFLTLIAIAAALFIGAVALAQSTASPSASLAANSRVFELRTYYVVPGKLEALHARFRDHTNKIFLKHDMQLVGYWVPKDKDGHDENKLVYMLAFASKEVHDQAWKDFASDPQWKKAKDDSEVNGKLVEKMESVLMTATDYSPIK